MVTVEQLQRILPSCPRGMVTRFCAPLNAAMAAYEITTPARQAAFIAQLAHESGEFRYVRELASGAAYEGRKDLGNTLPGDGVRFRGRGLIQITGRENYKACGEALHKDLLTSPELLETPELACLSAAWFWHTRKLNALADVARFVDITKRINGGTNGLGSRLMYWDRAVHVLGARRSVDGAEGKSKK